MSDDERKLQLQVLLEVQKQNQDISKTVSTLLISVIGSLITAVIAIFVLAPKLEDSISIAFIPYAITNIISYQIFILWDAQWRGGYQQHIEERINLLIGSEVVVWETLNSTPQRWMSVASLGFVSIMVMIWIFAMLFGIEYIFSKGRSQYLHIISYLLFSIILVSGYWQVFLAKELGYRFSKNGLNASHDEISEKAYEVWKGEGEPVGQENKHWEYAKELIRQEQLVKQKSEILYLLCKRLIMLVQGQSAQRLFRIHKLYVSRVVAILQRGMKA